MNVPNRSWCRQALVILLLFGGVLTLRWAFLEEADALAFDFVLRLRGEQPPDPRVVIVAIDDGSLQTLGPWPWAPETLDRIFRHIVLAGPRAVGVDILLSHGLDQYPGLNGSIPVVLAASLGASSRDGRRQLFWQTPQIPHDPGTFRLGHIHADKDSNGVCRSIPLTVSHAGQQYWAFALELARATLQIPASGIRFEGDRLHLGPTAIPGQASAIDHSIDSLGILATRSSDRLLINPRGAAATFPYVAAADVFRRDPRAMAQLTGKTVLVGATAYSLGDHISTPFSGPSEMPGIEIHANALDTVLGQRFLQSVSEPATAAILLAVIILSWGLFSHWQRARSLAAFALIVLLAAAVPLLLQLGFGVWVPLVTLVSSVILSGTSVQFLHAADLNRRLNRRFQLLAGLFGDRGRDRVARLPWLHSRRRTLEWKIQLLGEATEKAIRADREKEKLMAFLSHELKTPLTSVRGFTELLLSGRLAEADRREAAATIHEEVRRLTRLVNDFLEVSRLETRPLSLETPCRLDELLEEALRLFQLQTSAQPRPLGRGSQWPAVTVRGEKPLLLQVFLNLLSNAAKFSPPDREIRVSMELEKAAVAVSIRDEGCGIPEAEQDRIFDRFYRSPAAVEQAVPGSGLGLAFVREVIERHHGRVTIESALGQGSTFIIHLPRLEGASRMGKAS